jgi:hypothetical protein
MRILYTLYAHFLPETHFSLIITIISYEIGLVHMIHTYL